jgi:hypothetical protein
LIQVKPAVHRDPARLSQIKAAVAGGAILGRIGTRQPTAEPPARYRSRVKTVHDISGEAAMRKMSDIVRDQNPLMLPTRR